MSLVTTDAPTAALAGLDPDTVARDYHRRDIGRWTDARLAREVGRILAVPKDGPADSFVLHAALELLARVGLLRHVRPADREAARQRLVWLAATYEGAGEPVDPPAQADFASVADAAVRLAAAIEDGDLDDVDAAADWLGRRATAAELRRLLAAAVLPRLSAAAHAPILLWLLPRVAAGGEVRGDVLREPVRELARRPDWRLQWFEDVALGTDAPRPGSLVQAMLDVPRLGVPGSPFIHPVMRQAEESGVAAGLLAAPIRALRDPAQAGRELALVAAWSMLQEPTDHAAYGWSHCLTMPQAAASLATEVADPTVPIAVAATFVVGFRAALGAVDLDPDHVPPPPAAPDLPSAIDAGPDEAASWVWNDDGPRHDVVAELATRAARHEDAHLVKHTLACLDAADSDRPNARVHLAASARLHGWWATH